MFRYWGWWKIWLGSRRRNCPITATTSSATGVAKRWLNAKISLCWGKYPSFRASAKAEIMDSL